MPWVPNAYKKAKIWCITWSTTHEPPTADIANHNEQEKLLDKWKQEYESNGQTSAKKSTFMGKVTGFAKKCTDTVANTVKSIF